MVLLVALDPRTPVLVSSAQVTLRPDEVPELAERPEPARLMVEAIRASGAPGTLLAAAASLRVMLPLSWPYKNPGILVTEALGMEPKEIWLSTIGGNTPQMAANQAALEIQEGKLDVAVIVGAEAAYTRHALRRDPSQRPPPWTVQPDGTPEPLVLGSARDPLTEAERATGLDRPLRIFPLIETAIRCAESEDVSTHAAKLARLWSRFSEVAATNPYAWSRQALSAEEIATVGPENRMVCFPYQKLLNANDQVDQAAALVMCSLEAARRAKVPDDELVFLWAGADANDHWHMTHRVSLAASPAIRAASRHALGLAGIGVDDIAYLDLYSCFPSAVQIAANEIGVSLEDPSRPPTVTGGLTFAGGPGNNYATHAIATMASRLKAEPGTLGLVTGLGWYVTKHSIGIWSAKPPKGGFRHANPQEEVDALPQRPPAPGGSSDAVVEAYSVAFDREGRPETAFVSLLAGEGRTFASASDEATLGRLLEEDCCGASAKTRADGRFDLR